jgi:hypothetical protein
MKTYLISLLALFLLGFSSCEKEEIKNYGFDCSIEKSSNGLSIMAVDSDAGNIYLNGKVYVETGVVEVMLINPAGEVIFSGWFDQPGEINISETFQAVRGFWKLKYISRDGKGTLKLHIGNNLKFNDFSS